MLNEEERTKAEMLLEVITEAKEEQRQIRLSNYDFEWLAKTVIKLDDELKKLDVELTEVLDKEWAAHWARNKEEDNAK